MNWEGRNSETVKVKLSLCSIIKDHSMETYEGVEV
jgi:hypothetical protein